MTRQKLASLIAKHEGLKNEVAIGDIREILRILMKLEKDSTDWTDSATAATSGDISGWLMDEKIKVATKKDKKK